MENCTITLVLSFLGYREASVFADVVQNSTHLQTELILTSNKNYCCVVDDTVLRCDHHLIVYIPVLFYTHMQEG